VADLNFKNIYQVDAASGTTRQLFPFGSASSAVAVAYDPTTKVLYWTESTQIHQYSLLSQNLNTIYNDSAGIFHFSSRCGTFVAPLSVNWIDCGCNKYISSAKW